MSDEGSDRRGRVLFHDAEVVVTMDARRRELSGGSVLVRGNVIEAVDPVGALLTTAPRNVWLSMIDGDGW